MARESQARRHKLSAMRGLASSLGFDHDQRNVANRTLREQYAAGGGRRTLDNGDSGSGGPGCTA